MLAAFTASTSQRARRSGFTQEDPEIFYLDMFLERYDLDSTIDAITYDYEEF